MKIYFLDNEYNIYDEDSNLVGKIGNNGFVIDENNNLVYNGNIIGVIGGNLIDLEQTNNLNRSRGNVKGLKKNANAGFGQIMVVSLILFCLALFVAVFAISLFS